MRPFIVMSYTLASSLTVASASSLLQNKRDVSPDLTCGNTGAGTKGYTCPSDAACCSQYGYCGSTANYCETGCQSAFGTCKSGGGNPGGGPGTVSPDLTCGNEGAGKAGYICPAGMCCSEYGYCGNTADYCAAPGCQDQFGDCTAGSGDGDGTGDGETGSGRCGVNFNNAKCSSTECCSAQGYCGTTPDHCKAPDCQFVFGPACDANRMPAGTNTTTLPRSKLGGVAYGGAGIYDCRKDGTVALTYDDGPSDYTDDLLDLLAKYNAKATFFITGVNNNKGQIDDPATPWPAVIKRQHADGHQIASHTWSHADLSAITSAQRRDEMVKLEMALRNILGFIPTYMRPPYSSCTAASGCEKDLADLGYHITYFDLDTQDYLHTKPELIQTSKDIVTHFFEGKSSANFDALAIGHDIHFQTVYNLTEHMLSTVTRKGFKFVTVGECLNDPVSNWYRYDGGSNLGSNPSPPPSPAATTLASATRSAAATASPKPSTASPKPSTAAPPPPKPPSSKPTPADLWSEWQNWLNGLKGKLNFF